jgi:NAD(P)-dependent dehydrogenase (short-subunit alcohol dehydrogenase family)/enamine deaminase RidA (YjgF/YER057c/UK114 family)
MSGSLAGRGAVVTGGGRGIGAAVARALSAEGARVVVASRTLPQLEQVCAAARTSGTECWPVACDVTREDDVLALADAAAARLGAVDILVNAAGDAGAAPYRKLTLDEWERMFAVNATSTFLTTRALAPAMAERGWGRIVNVASVAGLSGAKYIAHYSAAKHAVIGFTESVARELEGTGVTVNAVCPGYVDTAMTERTIANVQTRTGLSRDEALRAVLASAGQDRLVTPAEVAEVVLAFCRDDAQVTGTSFLVNAGQSEGLDLKIINPAALGEPKGWNNGILAPAGSRTLFIAGQAGYDPASGGTPPDFPSQFAHALDRVLAVVREAGGEPRNIARMVVYVAEVDQYRDARKALSAIWRERLGRHYPTMVLVQVAALVDRGALVEIEATAVLGGA